MARDVFFDSANSNSALHAQLKPYCISARKQVESVWDQADPRLGGEVQLVIVIGGQGQLLNVFPRTLQDNALTERAVFAVTQCGRFLELPTGQDTLLITAIFKSKRPAFKADYSKIADAAVIAALIGLTGLAIYALLKVNSSNSGRYVSSGGSNPNYHGSMLTLLGMEPMSQGIFKRTRMIRCSIITAPTAIQILGRASPDMSHLKRHRW